MAEDKNNNTRAPASADKAMNEKIEQKVQASDEQWDDVKDKTSGVNKELEKKLEQGNVEPEDLNTQGG